MFLLLLIALYFYKFMANITLLTDFGLHDGSSGAAKGVVLSVIPRTRIIDISHEVPPFQVKQGAYLLGAAYQNFPMGTAHLAIVDVYYDATPKLVLSSFAGHYFLAPDNGIVPLALGSAPEDSWLCFELTKDRNFSDWLHAAANIIKLLASQTPAEIGLPAYKLKPPATQPEQSSKEIHCSVLYIDHYGNVVTDMTAQRFSDLNNNGRFTVSFMKVNEMTAISGHYNDVAAGNSLCRFNHKGYLEICINQGNASTLFGLRVGGKHNDIKITFE